MIAAVAASSIDIYEAVVGLSRSLAGRTDLRSLLAGVADSLRRIVGFDHIGLILHDPNCNAMQGYILSEPGNPVITDPPCRSGSGRVGLAQPAAARDLTSRHRGSLARIRATRPRFPDQHSNAGPAHRR
jgi:hypothetical protein